MAKFTFPGPVPKEALDYFRGKDLRIGFDHRDVWGQEHAAAFTVAKAMQLDLLDDIRGAVDSALAEGKTFRQFAKELTPTLQAKGWWGRKDQVDPLTGETREVQLGSPRRLKTIYNANLSSARSAGQWERIQRTKRALPFLLYELGPSEQHRPEHVAWAGTLLPVDDPWWQDHMPRNGWGCKCRVRQVSQREFERLKSSGVLNPNAPQEINPETGLPTGRRVARRIPVKTQRPQEQLVEWTNKRTGEVVRIDKGLDPAWASNPGQDRTRILRERLTDKVASTDQQMARAAVRNVVESPVLDGWIARPEGELPVAILGRRFQGILESDSQVVRLSPDTLDKQSRNHAELTAEHYRLLPGVIEEGAVIQQAGNRLVHFRRIDGRWHKAVVKRTEDGTLYLVSYHQSNAREVRREMRRGKVIRSVEQ